MRRALSLTLLLALTPPLLAQEAAGDEPYLKGMRQLTRAEDFSKAGEAYMSGDGRILFQAVTPKHPYYQIYVMGADGSAPRLVSPGQGKTTCAYFDPRDPKRFIYASTHLDPRTFPPPDPAAQGRSYRWDYDDSFDVFLGSLETGEVLARLTETPGYDAECSFSPDGKLICFTRKVGEDTDIWVMNADGSEQRAVVRVDGTDGGPFFSPDGQWLLYRASRGGSHDMQVFLTRLDGSETRQLTDSPRVNWAPYFHPSGEVVVYAGNVGGHRNFELFLVKVDGSRREVRLTSHPEFDGLPTFSPDGKQMVWTSTRSGGESQVWVADFVMPPEDAFQAPAAAPGEGREGGQAPRAGQGGAEHAQQKLLHPRARELAQGELPAGLGRINAEALGADAGWLADDAREGRLADSEGGRAAATWIAGRMRALGLRPGAAEEEWLQPFDFSRGAKRQAEGNALRVGESALTLDEDFQPLLYARSGDAQGELVFAGYGISAPKEGYDDFAGLDLKGKLALVLTGGPRASKGGAFGAEAPTVHEDLRMKISNCRDHGASGVLLVRAQGQGWLRLEAGDAGLPVAQLSAAAAARLGLDVAKAREGLEQGPASRSLAAQGALSVRLERIEGHTSNVIGVLPGSEPGGPVVVVGAHYDHLGHGESGGSLDPDSGAIHNGADDNASGVAGLLALAEALQAEPTRATFLFVAFGAEEAGLLGSRFFVEHPPLPKERIVAMVNLDMIGRLEGRPLLVGGAGTAPEWERLLQDAADFAGQSLVLQQDGFGPSDHASFYGAGIPVLFLWSGSHADYHKPSDDVARLDLPGAVRATRVALTLLRGIDRLPARPTYVKVERSDEPRRVVTGEGGAYFGSIPDYAQEGGEGVKLSGAKQGTPAAACGIAPGDVLVEFAGRRVANIHDFVNSLRLCQPGQQVKVVVLRGGERVTLEATLSGK